MYKSNELMPAPSFIKYDQLENYNSLIDIWQHHFINEPERELLIYNDKAYTCRELWDNILKASAFFKKQQLERNERVILKLDNSPFFFYAFYGAMLNGLIPVPIYHCSDEIRVEKIKLSSGAKLVINETGENGWKVHDIINYEIDEMDESHTRDQELAFLQYTSGTTANSKGVMLTHSNLLSNIRQMIPKGALTRDDVFVSWLPVYHDMGLIIMTMIPLYLGAKLVLLPISPKPFQWLGAIEKHKGTFTASPDFGYRFATKFSKHGGYDLSSLKFGLIAAEPIRVNTIKAFENKFGINGVLKPGYGLAEASVGFTFWDKDRSDIKVDENGYVAVGTPLNDMEVKILDENGNILSGGQQGEIVFKSPSGTKGYFKNEKASKELFINGYIKTGDIGYFDADGHLFIVGRKKSLIIKAGRNICPREIEEIADAQFGVRQSAAVGIESTNEEEIHLFIEIERKHLDDDQKQTTLKIEVNQSIEKQLGIKVDRFHFVEPHYIPKTYNGKIQYNKLKEQIKH